MTPFKDRQPYLLSCTVDFPDDVNKGVYTPDLLDEMMRRIKSMGVSRIYWLYYGDVDLDSYWAGNIFQRTEYGRETLNRIGEPVKAAVPVAHKHGMELYGVLKPYNTGVAGTHPEGSPEAGSTKVKRIGGTLIQTIPFLERKPHRRISRRPFKSPPGLETMPVKKIRLLKRDDSATRIREENVQVWTSEANYHYERRDVRFKLSEAVEPAPRDVSDFYGDPVTARGAPVRTLTLEGLNLTDRYILVTTNFKDQRGDFRNTAVGMLEAFGDDPEPLPIVVASRSAIWNPSRDFRGHGVEFDSGLGLVELALDADNSPEAHSSFTEMSSDGYVAFARGKNEFLPCTPCEVYPEVRKLWSGWVDRLVDAGVDGIDIRVSAHGSLTDEPFEYGFNEPILQEYRGRYGADLLGDDADLELLAQLRGEHYTSFLRETSAKVRSAGKMMQVHMHTEAFRPDLSEGRLMGFPANVHFDWRAWLDEGLLDGVTLRTSWFEALEDPSSGGPQRSRLTTALGDPIVEDVLSACRGKRVPAYLNRYVARAVGIDEYVADIETISHDDRFAGFDIYEWANIARPTPEGDRLVPVEDREERIRAKALEMGIIR